METTEGNHNVVHLPDATWLGTSYVVVSKEGVPAFFASGGKVVAKGLSRKQACAVAKLLRISNGEAP